MSRPTLRSLARSLGLSPATVSAALNGRGRVGSDTVRHIRNAAEAAGYRPNPLTSAVMSEVRRSRGDSFRGIVAAVEIAETARPAYFQRYHQEIVSGAAERAIQLGFKIERFLAGRGGLPLERLNAIFLARGIQGVIFLPVWIEPEVSRMDWSRFVGVYTDYAIERPALPSVYPDHYQGMMLALHRLRALGYRRPGLCLGPRQDERIQFRWEAAFLAFAANTCGLTRAVPPLKSLSLERREFMRWFQEYEPDVVLSHHPEAIGWTAENGSDCGQPGFVALNRHLCQTACAGLDLQPRLIGSLALDRVAARLHAAPMESEREIAAAMSVCPLWVEGPTLRQIEAPESSPAALAALTEPPDSAETEAPLLDCPLR